MIKPLPNPAYLIELKDRIARASKSIVAVNYLAEIDQGDTRDDPVRDIAALLADAFKRGVAVSVILEGSKLEQNYPFYRLMRKTGIDCWLDTSRTTIHEKACLIDDRLLFVGSQNWARASLETDSKEFSILTDDTSTIQVFINELKEVTRQRDDIRGRVQKDAVAIPASVMKAVINPLFAAHAMLAFDLYMMLFRIDGGRPREIRIDTEAWGRELGFDPGRMGKGVKPEYRRHYFEQRVNRILNQLRGRFGLVKIDRGRDTVIRRALPLSERVLKIPSTYWRLGWPLVLSFAAKYFYMISVLETEDSPFRPWWSLPILDVGKRYGSSALNISRGARELADYNILEIMRAVPKKTGGRYSEEATFYRLDPFYDMAEFQKCLDELVAKYSEKVVAQSQDTARILLKTHDLDTLETICNLIVRHGSAKVARAAKLLKATPTSSSRRILAYLIELIVGHE